MRITQPEHQGDGKVRTSRDAGLDDEKRAGAAKVAKAQGSVHVDHLGLDNAAVQRIQQGQSKASAEPDEAFRATPDVRGGIACFAETRVGVSQLLAYLWDGYTINDFLRDFPTVTKDQAQRAIERIDNEYIGGMERDCASEHRQGQDRGAGDGEFTT